MSEDIGHWWTLHTVNELIAASDTSRRGQANDAVEKRPDGEPLLQDEARFSPSQAEQCMKVTEIEFPLSQHY